MVLFFVEGGGLYITDSLTTWVDVTTHSSASNDGWVCDYETFVTVRLLRWIIAVPPPLACLGLCMMVYPLGSNADIIGLSVSVPVSQVSVNANMSRCWSMMKSWRLVVLLQTGHGLSVHLCTSCLHV